MKVIFTVAGLIGFNKSQASFSENLNFDDSADCSDVNVDQAQLTEQYDKTYVYKRGLLLDSAVSFLNSQNIPYGIKYFDNETTVITIKKKDDILLATQRWGRGD